MRKFQDKLGGSWVASVRERSGDDYKGRYWLVLFPDGAPEEGAVELVDVRWNSLKTAERTLRTMSEVELRRRHRSARGRSSSSARTT
ncbi:MAG: hypothetical protein ABIF09_03335 [Gemmatimonadota bacterium]